MNLYNISPFFFLSCIVVLCVLFTGCTDLLLIDGNIRYQQQPTSVQYTIEYGYTIECKGTGEYELSYLCDLPSVVQGSIASTLPLYAQFYREIMIHNNSVFKWNISGDTDATYTLGVSSAVQSTTLYVADLNGERALTTSQIRQQYADLVEQYCRTQSVDDVLYINPDDQAITEKAHAIRRQENTDNSFLLAKALFVWLKTNFSYCVHPENPNVQTALETFNKENMYCSGDCDDLSFLYISMCRALNIPARFIRGYLITSSEGMPSIGPHAWAEVFVGGNLGNQGWIPVECACTADYTSNIHQNFGVEDVSHLRLFVDDGSDDALAHSLSSVSWTYVPGMEITAESFVHVEQYMVLNQQQLVISKDGIRSYETPAS